MIKIRKKTPVKKKEKVYENREEIEKLSKFCLSDDLDENISMIKQYLGDPFDLKYRTFKVGNSEIHGAIIYLQFLVNADMISEHIIKPLMFQSPVVAESSGAGLDLEMIKDSMVTAGNIQEVNTFDKAVLSILSGDTLILVNCCNTGLIVSTSVSTGRDVEEPILEPTVKGAKEGFVEKLKDNLCLIRMRIKDPNLSFILHTAGRRTKTGVVIVYIRGIANQKIVNEVKNRIERIDIDGPIDAGQVQQLISDRPNSIYPLVQITERSDKLVSALLGGRVGIIIEGSPGILIVPVTLPVLMQSPDDYYEKWPVASFIRLLRYIAILVTVFFRLSILL